MTIEISSEDPDQSAPSKLPPAPRTRAATITRLAEALGVKTADLMHQPPAE